MKVFKVICALFILGFVSVSHAAVIFITENDASNNVTSLLGADNVEVNGLFYNVRFLDGTCIALFNDCDDPSDFFFTSKPDANTAAWSVLAQVFNDRTIFGEFPGLTNGCESGSACGIITPFFKDFNQVVGVVAFNRPLLGAKDGISVIRRGVGYDLTPKTSFVYAVWSEPVEASAPGTAMVLLMGIAGLIVSQRRKQA
jgi:hypothetical protein